MCNIILAQDRDGGDLGMLRQPAFQAVMGCVKRGTENQGRCSAGSSGVVRLGLCQGAFLERQFLVVMRSAFSLLGLVMGNQGVDRPTDQRVRHTVVRISSTAAVSDGCLAPWMRRSGVRVQHRTRMTR